MIKSIINYFTHHLSCASVIGAQGVGVFKSSSVLLESAGVELTEAGISTTSFLSQFLDIFVEIINSWIYTIAKYILMFVDFCQVITYKIAGIDTDLGNIVDQPIFKFLLNDTVLKTIGTLLIVGLVLLILATIIAIIKSEYEARLEDKKDAKSSAYKSLGKASIALFLMVITPFIIVVAIIFSSVMLSSVNNVLNSNDTEYATIGGTLFQTSAYNANKYRLYAMDGKRIPVILNFEDPYENGTYGFYTAEELKEIYDGWNGEEIYKNFATGNFMSFNDSLTYKNGKLYNSNAYSDYERFVATSEQYQVMADFIDYAVSHEINYYIKDSNDKQIDWSRTSSAIKITDGVYDPVNGSISITYSDVSNLSPYEDYYTITFETSTASADTPIANAVKTISLILGLNSIVSGNAIKNTTNTVGPVNMVTTSASLSSYAEDIENVLQKLTYTASSSDGAVTFRLLERVDGSINVVRWKTEKAIYNGQEYIVYELKKVYKNTQTGINETRATVKVAKKDDSLDSRYYVLEEEPNEFGYYSYTNVTIDYYNDGKLYLDALTPVYKKATWPEKLYNDLSVIYSDIDFDSFIAYDNWADSLGSYFKTDTNVTSDKVSSFSTTLIHPLGLIMSELFLGTTMEKENKTGAGFSFVTEYTDDMIDSIALAVGGQFDYAGIKQQIEYFMKLFNNQFAKVIKDLQDYESFDLYGNDPYSCQGYVYKAYLASIMLSDDYSNYLFKIANTLVTSEKLLELMSINSGGVIYDSTGNIVYKIEAITDDNGEYAPLYYKDNLSSGKAVYVPVYNYGIFSGKGKKAYTADRNGELSPNGIYVPKAGVTYTIAEKKSSEGSVYEYQVLVGSEYISPADMISDAQFNELSAKDKRSATRFTDYFQTFFEYSKGTGVITVFEPSNSDTTLETATVTQKTIELSEQLNEALFKGATQEDLSKITLPTEIKEYFLPQVDKSLDSSTKYLTYGELPKVYQDFITTIISDIERDVAQNNYNEPVYLKFLKEYKSDSSDMQATMSAPLISSSQASDYLKQYDDIVKDIAFYEDLIENANANDPVSQYGRSLTKLKSKLNALKKYYIIKGIENYSSTKVTSGFTVIVNSHAFTVDQGLIQRELLEIIYGNKLTYMGIINLVGNETSYDRLGKFDKLAYQQLSSFARYYATQVGELCEGTISTAKLFKGDLTDKELDILGEVYSIKSGKAVRFTNSSLKIMGTSEKENLLALLNRTIIDIQTIIDNYSGGKTINAGTIYSIDVGQAYQLLKSFLSLGAQDEKLYFVANDYEGIISDNLKGFELLKSFLTNFGDLCFDLARESNLGSIGQFETEDVLDYISELMDVLNTRLDSLNLGGEFDRFEKIDKKNPLKSLKLFTGENLNDVSSERARFAFLNAGSKEYLYTIYQVYNKKVTQYEAEAEVYKKARDYAVNYINGRYAMQSDSFVFDAGLKEYLNYFRYNADILSTDFGNYYYESYQGSKETTEDKLYYYNLYLEAFDNITLGTSGVYYEGLSDLQKKVIADMAEYYKKSYNEFLAGENQDYVQNLYNRQLLNGFIFENKAWDYSLDPDTVLKTVADATQTTLETLFVENVDLLNLCNVLDYIGIDYEIDKTLADYRLEALNMLVDFKERVGESGASIQARYLTTLYLVCANYSLNTVGQTTITVDSATKATILKLAGIENKAEENLVGLTYEMNSTDAVSDEKYGSVFIICTYNAETNKYEPFVFASGNDGHGTPKSSYYHNLDGKITYYPVVAKGVIGPDNLPTAIRQVNGCIEFYRESVVIADVGTLGLDMYYMTVEDIAINYNPISVAVNGLSSLFTGKSLAQHILDAFPVIVSSKNMNFAYGTQTNCVYYLENGGFTLNYMFYKDSGIALNCLYNVSEFNGLILALGTAILAFSMISAMFGVIRNLYELVLMVMIYPGVLGLYPLKEDYQKNWRKEFIDKLLVMLGYILAINCFFIILNLLQRMEIKLTLSQESIAELKSTYLFGQFDLESIVSTLMTFMMFLVACTLLKTLPDFFAKLAGVGGNVESKGDETRKIAKINIQEATYFSSGYAVADMVGDKMDKLKAIPLAGNLINNVREQRQITANRRAVSEYEANLKDIGRQRLIEENVNKYQNKLVKSGQYKADEIDGMVAKYKNNMESKDHEQLIKESVEEYRNKLVGKGIAPATIKKAVSAYEKRIRGMSITDSTIQDAVKTYEASLAKQIETQRKRRENDQNARIARINARVERIGKKDKILKPKPKKKTKFCPVCKTEISAKAKVCPRCNHKV